MTVFVTYLFKRDARKGSCKNLFLFVLFWSKIIRIMITMIIMHSIELQRYLVCMQGRKRRIK